MKISKGNFGIYLSICFILFTIGAIGFQFYSSGSAGAMWNITIKWNKLALNYTFEELIKTNIASDILKLKTNRIDIVKQRANLDVLNYLDRNPKISKLSSFNIIKKMKYKNLLKAYFISKEFENSIIELHQKNERDEYIERYINEALRYVHYFENNKIDPKNKNKDNNIIEIIYDEEEKEEDDSNNDEWYNAYI